MTTEQELKLRVAHVTTGMPHAAALVLQAYRAMAADRCLGSASLAVDMVPKSLNHQYIRSVNYRNKTNSFGQVSKQHFINTRLHPDVEVFRLMVKQSCVANKIDWRPTGLMTAVIFFESDLWVTKKHTIRQTDVDNRVKAVFDALSHATGIDDRRVWQFHAFKIFSKRQRTTVHLFDLGDIVPCYQDFV